MSRPLSPRQKRALIALLNGSVMRENLVTTTTSNRGSVTTNQELHFTSIYKHIKASIVSVLMWLSAIGLTL